jgi:predicted alpha/beta superfamily hydrolase
MSLFLVLSFSYSQEIQENSMGEKFSIQSEILNKGKDILVYLPQNYQSSKANYPVLYIIDGQSYFPLAVGILNILSQFNNLTTPEFIIVSIVNENNNRARYSELLNKQVLYLRFIEKELIPQVSKRYRASTERFLFAWQYGASFAIQSLFQKPNLFNAYFVADPYPLMEKFDESLNGTYERLSKNLELDNFLYMRVGKNAGTVKEGAEHFRNKVQETKLKSLNLDYGVLQDEEHRSTPFSTLYHGLKAYYHNYSKLQLKNYQEYKDLGGFGYIEAYYKQRAKRFSFSSEIESWTMFTLLREQIRENDFETFEILMSDFKETKLISNLRLSRALLIAEFYLKHHNRSKAIDLYRQVLQKHPESEQAKMALEKALETREE